MSRLIPEIIDELEYLNSLSSKYEPLVAYYKEFGTIGNINMGDTYNYQGRDVRIGIILSNLRRPDRKAKLTQKEIDLLDSMGMVWHKNKDYDRLAPLKAYYEQFGSISNIGCKDVYNYQGKDISLGNLILNLRMEYKKGKLDDKRIKLLNSMGMVWLKYNHDFRLDSLKAYYEEFGTIANIGLGDIYNYQGKDVRIGGLINHLRAKYKNGKLSEDYIQVLNSWGMNWGFRDIVKFKDRLEPLIAYYKEFGTLANIKSQDIYNYQGKKINIGVVIQNLRTDYKKNKLSSERIQLLNSMGMMWDRTQDVSRLEPLKAYYKEFGTIANIGAKDIYKYQGKKVRIGQLIVHLRYEYRQNKLNDKTIQTLNSMGMAWDYDMLIPIKAYYEEFGTIANIKSKEIYIYQGKKVQIGSLIYRLRKGYQKGKLDDKTVDLLNNMGMIWSIGRGNRIQTKFNDLIVDKTADLKV